MFTSDEQAALLALIDACGDIPWHSVASVVEMVGSACRVLAGDADDADPAHSDIAARLADWTDPAAIPKMRKLIDAVEAEGAWLTTVLDEQYPGNLREVYNRPPFLFVRGTLLAADERAVSVVGTRRATDEGLRLASQFSAKLARHDVTVLSGLAQGVDAAAHEAALEAGGRTVAVLGTGIRRVYPPAHEDLAERVAAQGAVVSQFWPDAPPTKSSFPMRNVVTSGLGIGTVVVEADGKSGARNQARRCIEHGKRLFLVESLVTSESWTARYVDHPAVTVVSTVDDVLAALDDDFHQPEQLTLLV